MREQGNLKKLTCIRMANVLSTRVCSDRSREPTSWQRRSLSGAWSLKLLPNKIKICSCHHCNQKEIQVMLFKQQSTIGFKEIYTNNSTSNFKYTLCEIVVSRGIGRTFWGWGLEFMVLHWILLHFTTLLGSFTEKNSFGCLNPWIPSKYAMVVRMMTHHTHGCP